MANLERLRRLVQWDFHKQALLVVFLRFGWGLNRLGLEFVADKITGALGLIGGPQFCAMKITDDVRQYAAEQGIAEQEALKQGMKAKSKEFVAKGAEVYAKA